jgi:hypothetical protein
VQLRGGGQVSRKKGHEHTWGRQLDLDGVEHVVCIECGKPHPDPYLAEMEADAHRASVALEKTA